MEEWKRVPGGTDDNYYEATATGRVRHIIVCELKQQLANSAQYKRVTYSSKLDRKSCFRSVHSLVAAAFLGARPDGLVVNHKDGNKLNNNLANLEYVTHSGNALHAVRLGLKPTGARHHWNTRPELREKVRGSRSGMSRLHEDDVAVIRIMHDKFSITDKGIADVFGISRGNVGFIVNRTTWRHVQ